MNIEGSIMESYADTFCFMVKQRQPDGAGGFTPTWSEGQEFLAVQQHDQTIDAQKAEREGTASTYTFFVDKGLYFDYHEVIKRKSDGQYFRITSPTNDVVKTPDISNLDMSCVIAEKWELTT